MAVPRDPNSETQIEGVPRPDPQSEDLDSTRWNLKDAEPLPPEAQPFEVEGEEEDEERERGLTTRWDHPSPPPPPPPPRPGKTTRWGVERPGSDDV